MESENPRWQIRSSLPVERVHEIVEECAGPARPEALVFMDLDERGGRACTGVLLFRGPQESFTLGELVRRLSSALLDEDPDVELTLVGG